MATERQAVCEQQRIRVQILFQPRQRELHRPQLFGRGGVLAVDVIRELGQIAVLDPEEPPVSPFRSRSGSNRMLPYGPENGRCFSCSPMSLPACISPSLPYQTALFSEAGRTRSSGVNSRMGRRYSPRAPLAPMEKQSRPWRKNFVRYVFAGWMYA